MKRNGAILDLFRKHEEKARKIATEHHTEDIENARCPNSPPPIHSDADMDTDTEIDVEIEDATPSLPSPQQPSAHVFSGDPGKRTPILEYAFNDQDSVRRRYIAKVAS